MWRERTKKGLPRVFSLVVVVCLHLPCESRAHLFAGVCLVGGCVAGKCVVVSVEGSVDALSCANRCKQRLERRCAKTGVSHRSEMCRLEPPGPVSHKLGLPALGAPNV